MASKTPNPKQARCRSMDELNSPALALGSWTPICTTTYLTQTYSASAWTKECARHPHTHSLLMQVNPTTYQALLAVYSQTCHCLPQLPSTLLMQVMLMDACITTHWHCGPTTACFALDKHLPLRQAQAGLATKSSFARLLISNQITLSLRDELIRALTTIVNEERAHDRELTTRTRSIKGARETTIEMYRTEEQIDQTNRTS